MYSLSLPLHHLHVPANHVHAPLQLQPDSEFGQCFQDDDELCVWRSSLHFGGGILDGMDSPDGVVWFLVGDWYPDGIKLPSAGWINGWRWKVESVRQEGDGVDGRHEGGRTRIEQMMINS